MNVLLVGNRALDRDGPGDAKMAFWTYKALSAAGHHVSVLVLDRNGVARRGLQVLGALVNGEPLQVGLTYSRATAEKLMRLALVPDLVIAVHARAAAHIPGALRPRGLAMLIDAYGQSYATYAGRLSKPMDLLFRFERRRMDAFERRVVAEFARTAVVSDVDRAYLASRAKSPSSVVRLSLPVDLEHFGNTRRRAAAPPVFVFVGRLNYLPNRDAVGWLAADIWPAIRARYPKAAMRVVGARPNPAIRRLLARQGIALAADVPDIRQSLEDATALLVPMRMGGGIQTKTLEAMAAGVPIISTAFGCRGMTARPEEQVLLAETPLDFARQAGRLVADPDLASQLATGGRAWIAAHHSPAIYEREILAVAGEIVTQAQHQTVPYD